MPRTTPGFLGCLASARTSVAAFIALSAAVLAGGPSRSPVSSLDEPAPSQGEKTPASPGTPPGNAPSEDARKENESGPGNGKPRGPAAAARTGKPIDATSVELAAVHIRAIHNPGNGTITIKDGSGVYLGNGRVLTASHVLDAYTTIEVVFGGRSGQPATTCSFDSTKGKVLSYTGRDVTLITGIAAPAWAPIAKIAASPAKVGDQSVSIGVIANNTTRIRHGQIVDTASTRGAFHADSTSQPGDSGGPTLNNQLEVVGICSGVMTATTFDKAGKQTRVSWSVSYDVAGLKVDY